MRRAVTGFVILALLGTGLWFRVAHLGRIPGISGDEAWWGVQATRWVHGQPYERTTTSGNPIDKFLLVPLGIAHRVAPASFTLLRGVPTALNLIALLVGFFAVRRIYGAGTAWIFTVATAILPAGIAHGRICQDPSQSIAWTGLVVWLSLLGVKEPARAWLWGTAALAAFPIAVWTHPTNVFVAPFLVLPFGIAVARLLPPARKARAIAVLAGTAVLVAGVVAWMWLAYASRGNDFLSRPWLALVRSHVASPRAWLEFAINYGRLFDGVAIYHSFVDPHLVSVASDAGFVVVALAALCGLALVIRRRESPVDASLAGASIAMALLYFAFAGPEGMRPHFERWALCLVAPGTLMLARGVSGWVLAYPAHRGWATAFFAVFAAALLGAFYLDYFRQFETVGGRADITYVTGPREPKQLALETILMQRSRDEPVMIVATLWWQYWPITYLAQNHRNVITSRTFDVEGRPEFADAVRRGGLFLVEYFGTVEHLRAVAWLRAHGLTATSTPIRDASGRELLDVMRVERAK